MLFTALDIYTSILLLRSFHFFRWNLFNIP